VRCHRGNENVVADVLSRIKCSANKVNSRWSWYNKKYWGVKENPDMDVNYQISEGRLFKKVFTSLSYRDKYEWKVCIDWDERKRALQEAHNGPTVGHVGTAKTIVRLAHYHYWPGMRKDAAKYVQSCRVCKKNKALQQAPAGEKLATDVLEPWQMVSIDLVGSQAVSHRRNVWLLVMQDHLSKWIELAALRKATSANVIAKVRQHIILRYGCPKTIISDNGRQFISQHFGEFLKDCGIQHRKTPPYTPHCNPVERTKRIIKTIISQFVVRDHKNWDKHLAKIAFVYNTAQSAVTGYSPAFLNSGREPVHPGALHRDVKKPSGKSNLGIRLEKIRDALTLARLNVATNFKKQNRHYNQGCRDWRPTVGERVMFKTHILPDKNKGIKAKLAPRYDGPYVVLALPSRVIVTLAHIETKETRQAHIGNLQPYVSRE
jgi:transposase